MYGLPSNGFWLASSISIDSPDHARGVFHPRAASAACYRSAGLPHITESSIIDLFSRFRPRRPDHARARRREIPDADANSDADHPDCSGAARRHRHCADRHRQDRRLCPADPAASGRRPAPTGAENLPRPGARSDARAGEPDRRQLPRLWRGDAAVDGGGVRRRPDRPPARADGAWGRYSRRHPGTPARSDRFEVARSVECSSSWFSTRPTGCSISALSTR